MKKFITLLALCSFAYLATAQTPFSMVASHDDGSETSALSANSLNNPWVGATLGYNITGDVSESFILSARAMYAVAKGPRYSVPFVGNVGLNNADTLGQDNGVSFGLFPWYNLSGSGNLALLLHGGLNYQILDKTDASAGNQFRIMAGLEAIFYPSDGTGAPATLSVAPEYVTSTGLVNVNAWNLNLTGVIPIANGLGLLLDGAIPLGDDNYDSGFKIGVVVAAPIR